jgi:hypothetical protein
MQRTHRQCGLGGCQFIKEISQYRACVYECRLRLCGSIAIPITLWLGYRWWVRNCSCILDREIDGARAQGASAHLAKDDAKGWWQCKLDGLVLSKCCIVFGSNKQHQATTT